MTVTFTKQCNNNQTATCSCGPGGASGSCTTHTNQGGGGIDLADTVFAREFQEANLLEFCRLVKKIDEDWTCTVMLATSLPTVTNSTEESATFEEALHAVAAEHGRCAEIDGANKAVTFRPIGTCI